MKTTFIKAITAAALISGAALAGAPASAMGFKNCTGEQIRIKIYNNHDVSKIVAKRNKTFGVNDYHWFKLDSDLYQVRIYRSRSGKDTEVYLKGGLNGGHKFSVRKSGRRYSISTTNDCGSANVKPPKPVATIAVNAGRWVGAKPIFTISNVTANSFTLDPKGKKRPAVTYTLVANDTYNGSDGKVFVMTASGRATWGGVPYRRK